VFQALALVCQMVHGLPSCTEFSSNEKYKTKEACEEFVLAETPNLKTAVEQATGREVVHIETVCVKQGQPS